MRQRTLAFLALALRWRLVWRDAAEAAAVRILMQRFPW